MTAREWKVGDRVVVAIPDPEKWAHGAAEALNGTAGVISEIRPIDKVSFSGRHLVTFDHPARTWWANQTPPESHWFDADELAAPDEVIEAFEAGRIYVTIDKPRPMSRGLGMFVGDRAIPDGEPIRFVHVMSKPAGGEIRGYVLTRDGELRLRLPCYSGRWEAMDLAVLARVDGARTVTPYAVSDAGVARG